MKISRDNYEEFFLGYLDGRLTDAEILAMEDFLLLNPDLRRELEGLEDAVLVPRDVHYPFIDILRKTDLSLPVVDENFDDFCAVWMEGDLTPDQIDGLDRYLRQNPAKKADRELYARIRLSPDPSVTFPGKQKLRKSLFVIQRHEIVAGLAVAAGIALLAGTYFGFMEHRINTMTQTQAFRQDQTPAVDTARVERPSPAVTAEPGNKPAQPAGTETAPRPVKQKPASRGISFRVDMPVASNEGSSKKEHIDEGRLLSRVRIDPGRVNETAVLPGSSRKDNITLAKLSAGTSERQSSAGRTEYLSIEQFAKQKFSTLVFGKEAPRDLTVWNVVIAGIDKVNDLTGANMKLERKTDPQGETRALKFDSKLLKINAPVNKDE